MATIKAIICRVDEFENAKQIKLTTDVVFTTLKEGVETEVNSFNFTNINLQLQLKKFSHLFRRIELFCMGHRAKPQLFKLLLENAAIDVEQIIHKAGELRQDGTPSTFDWYENVIQNVEFPKLDEEQIKDLKDLMINPKLEKPIVQTSDDELLKLLYNK